MKLSYTLMVVVVIWLCAFVKLIELYTKIGECCSICYIFQWKKNSWTTKKKQQKWVLGNWRWKSQTLEFLWRESPFGGKVGHPTSRQVQWKMLRIDHPRTLTHTWKESNRAGLSSLWQQRNHCVWGITALLRSQKPVVPNTSRKGGVVSCLRNSCMDPGELSRNKWRE